MVSGTAVTALAAGLGGRRRPASWALAVSSLLALFASPVRAQLGESGLQFWHAGSPGLSTAPEADAWLGHAAVAGDFDGDGFDDLAVSLPRATVGGDGTAGEVLVLPGGNGGLTASGHQVWNQDSPGIADAAEPNDFFGWSLAAGDFDGDGFADLVIGVPFEDLAGFESAGAFHVLPGSAAGLSATGSLYWTQETAGVADAAQPGDSFGAAFAVGDFDDDGFDDLAVGAPAEDQEGVPTYTDLGALHVFFGSAGGLTTAGSRFFRPGDGVVALPAPANSIFFAAALAAGPFLPFDEAQLAVGVPRADVAGADAAGAVAVISNPDAGGIQIGFFTQDSAVIPGVAEAGDNFGAALAAGRFDGSVPAALVVGAPGEGVGPEAAAGTVTVLTDLFTSDFAAALWSQDLLPPFTSEADDRFGAELAVGDFDGNGREDLAIGAPGETIGGIAGFGGGAVLYGSENGITDSGFQGIPLGVFKVVEDLQLGYALAPGRFSGHQGHDLAMTMPRASIDLETDAGAFLVMPSVVLFVDGFESGDSSRWSASVP